MAAAPGQVRYTIYINYGGTVPSFKLTFGGFVFTETSYGTNENYTVAVTAPTSEANYWTITIDVSDTISPTYILETDEYVTERGTLAGATNNTKSFTLMPKILYAYKSKEGYTIQFDNGTDTFVYLKDKIPVANSSRSYLLNNASHVWIKDYWAAYLAMDVVSSVSGDDITINCYIEK